MDHTIQLTAEQFEALQSGKPITIEPPKSAITKWEPKPGAFTIDLVSLVSYEAASHDNYRLAGAEYQTKSQADSAAKQLRAYARQLAYLAENDDGWVADWSNMEQCKYYIYFSHARKLYDFSSDVRSLTLGLIYMSKDNATKLAQLMNDDVVEF